MELLHVARSLALPTTGGKQLLTERIAAALDGTEFVEPAPRQARAKQLSGQLSAETVIPRGQRCSQVVRAWFTEQVGPGFHFDEPLREFFRTTDGTDTLASALAHWHATRHTAPKRIGPQFEYNRFTRDWYIKNPGGTREQLLDAWQAYRARPVDGREQS